MIDNHTRQKLLYGLSFLLVILLSCSAQNEGRLATGNLTQQQVAVLIQQAAEKKAAQQLQAAEPTPVETKSLSIPAIGASEAPRNDGVHDATNDSIDVLQDPTKALAAFPRDRRLQVDWVKALDQGLIEPRADLLGKNKMVVMDMDIIMKNTQMMPWVRFPHIAHTKWLACENCHPAIFIPQENANPISMNKVLRGEYCGVCHDKVAFALFICERCHSVPHEGSGPKWW